MPKLHHFWVVEKVRHDLAVRRRRRVVFELKQRHPLLLDLPRRVRPLESKRQRPPMKDVLDNKVEKVVEAKVDEVVQFL